MSAKQTGIVWELDIPFNKAWVLMALADHADHDGRRVFPSMRLVAWKTSYSISSVRRIVAELRDDGILIPDGKTAGGVVIYRIVTAHVARKPPLRNDEEYAGPRPRTIDDDAGRDDEGFEDYVTSMFP